MNLTDPIFLQRNLAFVHQYIVASEQLLEQAIPLAEGEVKAYFETHLLEERGHAAMLLEDLQGFAIPLQPLAAAMAGTAYYFIQHVHPAALLGYMAVLERPMDKNLIKTLEQVHGTKLLRCARLHAVEDRWHFADLLTLIQKQPDDIRRHIGFLAELTIKYLDQSSALLKGLECQ